MLYVFSVAGHDHTHEIFGHAISIGTFNQHLFDITVVKIADNPLDQRTLFIDWCRRYRFQRKIPDLIPKPLQIFIIALDLGFCALAAGGADNQACTFRHFNFARDFFQFLTVNCVGDLA